VARFEGDRIVVLVPASMPTRERQRVAEELASRLLRRHQGQGRADDEALTRRARDLSARYLEGKAAPAEVRWVSNQEKSRWGSCTTVTGTLRISARLQGAPGWVLDYVLVHELAHLLEPSHGPAFKSLVSRYPRSGEAAIWLAGYGHGLRVAGGEDPPTGW
jgi:hypothetical protein